MKEKTKVWYINFSVGKVENDKPYFLKKYWSIRETFYDDLSGISVIRNKDIIKTVDENELARLKRKLGRFDYSDAVIIADYKMSGLLGIEDMMFQARKNEFINNREYIIDRIQEKYLGNENATVVIDNTAWSRKELFVILRTLKDYYRKIKILTDASRIDLGELAEVFYDEWGAVISIYRIDCYPVERQNFVLFLLKRWNPMWTYRIRYDAAYVVENVQREHKRMQGTGKNTFSGLVYNSKKPLSYELGVNMAWQKPAMYEKFRVNVIDIYELE